MGCDIHGWVEFRYGPPSIKGDMQLGWWTALHAGHILTRHYLYFSRFFGVQSDNDEPGAFGDRGLPNKLSAFVEDLYKKYESDYHSPTWCTAKELLTLQSGCEDGDWNVLFQLIFVLASYYGDDNVRLVVWFDN